MSSRWVYHHRREHGVTHWRTGVFTATSGELSTRPRLCIPPPQKHNTHHHTHTHHYILLRSLCIITLSLFSRDRGFSCLEIPISVVIWKGLGKGKKGKRCDTYFWSILVLFCLLLLREQLVQLTLFMLAACDLLERNWMDWIGLIFTLRTLVRSFWWLSNYYLLFC
jgi:hypothetical protein